MTSLFTDLVAAAFGDAPAMTPPPRLKFEDAPPPGDFEPGQPAEALLSPLAHDPAPGTGHPTRAPTVLAGESATVGPTRSPLLPPAAGETSARLHSAPAPNDRPDPSMGRGEPRKNAEAPAAPGALPPAHAEVRPRLAEPKAVMAAPLLPTKPKPDLATTAAARPAAADNPAEPVAPSISLTIGRIEVRPPPAPVSRANAAVPTRPVIIKRAPVRQSLDEYRSRPRR